MKKIISVMLIISMLSISLVGCSSKKDGEKEDDVEAKIAIVTEDQEENPDGYKSADYISNMYKFKKENGFTNDEIKHIVMPKDFVKNANKSEETINKLAKDKDIKAVVFSSREKGMLTYANKLKEARKDMVVLGADLNATEKELADNLDLSYISDTTLDGKNTVQLAKEMGAKAFILYYSDKDLKDKPTLSKKISEIESECVEQDLVLEKVKVQDINSKEDEYSVKKFISEDINKEIYKYGEDINLYGTNYTMDDVILRRAIKNTLAVAETSDGCMVNQMGDFYRVFRKTLDNGNYRGFTKYISDGSLKYEMNGRLGGIIMPNRMFTIYAAADTAIAIIENEMDVKKAYNSYFIEKSIYEKEGLTAAFNASEEGYPNVKIVSIDQVIY
ncbi:DUF3798 domain-containing protein [Peptacetobacter sp. AB845]|uniref:DUF3798 domain-containing protein n=1 Tax=Peptacetobacter sp. AB845 TaxID=3388429 RepID=UPI0039C9AAAE